MMSKLQFGTLCLLIVSGFVFIGAVAGGDLFKPKYEISSGVTTYNVDKGNGKIEYRSVPMISVADRENGLAKIYVFNGREYSAYQVDYKSDEVSYITHKAGVNSRD